jgi:hypothetical protein
MLFAKAFFLESFVYIFVRMFSEATTPLHGAGGVVFGL